MAFVTQKRAVTALGLVASLSIGLLTPIAPALAQSADNGELIQLSGAGASSPYDLLEEPIEHMSCEGAILSSCTSQILFVAEVPDSSPPGGGRRVQGARIKYTFTVTNGGIEPEDNIRVGTLPRNGVICSETDFLEFGGDFAPSNPVILGDLFAGNVVLERLEPNASVTLSFICQVK